MKNGKIAPAALLLGMAAIAPAQSDAPELPALAQLERGQWELRDVSDESRLRASICIGEAMLLMQPQHGTMACDRTVIASRAKDATVHYRCPAAGFGRTTIRVETPRLANVETQGIQRGTPFAFRLEARRVGPCPNGGSPR